MSAEKPVRTGAEGAMQAVPPSCLGWQERPVAQRFATPDGSQS